MKRRNRGGPKPAGAPAPAGNAPKAGVVDWDVFLLRRRAQWIGRVKARDEAEALERAGAELEIAPAERFRLSVQRAGG